MMGIHMHLYHFSLKNCNRFDQEAPKRLLSVTPVTLYARELSQVSFPTVLEYVQYKEYYQIECCRTGKHGGKCSEQTKVMTGQRSSSEQAHLESSSSS